MSIKTEMDEFNRVLGGGVVPGSLVLIGITGDPEGKSTLFCRCPLSFLIRAPFSMSAGKNQLSRLSRNAPVILTEFYLYAETNMQNIRTEIEKIKPDFLIIDSIQTVMSPKISSVQGSVSQVRGDS